MEISDARKLKALENEGRRLKKLLAESKLDASTLKVPRDARPFHDLAVRRIGIPAE